MVLKAKQEGMVLVPVDVLYDWRKLLASTSPDDAVKRLLPEIKAMIAKAKEGMVDAKLTERRAKFVYDAARLAAQAAEAPIIPVPWDEREKPFKDQFLEVIDRQCSGQRSRSPEELHGSWMRAYFTMGWKYGEKHDPEKKTHPDLVPYTDLGQLEQDKDAVFIALCEIARQWVY